MSVNIVAKCIKGKEFIITEMIGTRMTKAKWEQVKNANPKLFGDDDSYTWRYIPQKETSFEWWSRIEKKLTPTKIVRCGFDIDYTGNVTEY